MAGDGGAAVNLPGWMILASGTALFLWFSRKPLRYPGSHGFWRFFAWEAMLCLVLITRAPAGDQSISAALMLGSPIPLALGLLEFSRYRRPRGSERPDEALYGWEKTSTLITTGIYRWIRHPMYASLLMLNWGLYFKAVGIVAFLTASLASGFLMLTALADERECLAVFGDDYRNYMKTSRRFVPLLF